MNNSPRIDYSREELIALCERAVVPMDKWRNRDSASAHQQMARAWVILRAGAPFTVNTTNGNPPTDDRTIWVEIEWHGFNWFEWGSDEGMVERETFYIPTAVRLDERADNDWY